MVTAVQPMFGLLKRLHLHPMENALNELNPQTSLLQSIKFRAQPFLFPKSKSEEIQVVQDSCTGHKRQSSYLPNSDLKAVKRSRRTTKLSDKELNYLEVNVKSNYYESPTALQYTTLTNGLTPSNLQLFSSSTSISSPNVSTSSVSNSRRSLNSSEQPSILSSTKGLCSSSNLLQSTNQYESQVTVVFQSNSTTDNCQESIFLSKNDSLPDDEKHLDITKNPVTTVCSFTNNSTLLTKETTYPSEPTSTQIRYLTRSHNTQKCTVSLLSRRCDNCDDEKSNIRLKNKEKVTVESKAPIVEPSIHRLSDGEISTKPRTRRSTQFLQSNSQTTESLCTDQKSAYLTSQSYYYAPNFAAHRPRCPEISQLYESEPRGTQRIPKSNIFIEVPSWRVIPIPITGNNLDCSCGRKHSTLCSKNQQANHKLTDTDNLKSHNLRTVRSSLLTNNSMCTNGNDTASTLSRLRSRSGCLKTQKSHSQTIGVLFEGEETEAENISDAAYLARHSRLEVEEARRERLSRQRTAEQELKQRLEERDQASWHKRQSGRLDRLLKFQPAKRMPTHLNYTFREVHQFHLENCIPVIVFGCRVPSASLIPFTKSS